MSSFIAVLALAKGAMKLSKNGFSQNFADLVSKSDFPDSFPPKRGEGKSTKKPAPKRSRFLIYQPFLPLQGARGGKAYESILAYLALRSMNSRRGATSSPISMLKV
jgi:hypothetical protein